ncbi:hypothetical protein LZ32DRAFT_607637 [Colletotrichum eremochloae]|nr:hypothetical protein LZ32DRAFT_607637 [Colletotrichum eremochloae]
MMMILLLLLLLLLLLFLLIAGEYNNSQTVWKEARMEIERCEPGGRCDFVETSVAFLARL